jgi:hypothetical protein
MGSMKNLNRKMRASKNSALIGFDEEVMSSQQRMGRVAKGRKKDLRDGLSRRTKRLKEAGGQAMQKNGETGSISGTGIASKAL